MTSTASVVIGSFAVGLVASTAAQFVVPPYEPPASVHMSAQDRARFRSSDRTELAWLEGVGGLVGWSAMSGVTAMREAEHPMRSWSGASASAFAGVMAGAVLGASMRQWTHSA